jgi:hypothetical protein
LDRNAPDEKQMRDVLAEVFDVLTKRLNDVLRVTDVVCRFTASPKPLACSWLRISDSRVNDPKCLRADAVISAVVGAVAFTCFSVWLNTGEVTPRERFWGTVASDALRVEGTTPKPRRSLVR